MAFNSHPIRAGLYVALFLFAVPLLGLAAARLGYTLSLSSSDVLNDGISFYDAEAVVLVVASSLAILWSLFAMYGVNRRPSERRGRPIFTFLVEFLTLFVIWGLYLGGAAAASNKWNNLGWCRPFRPCRVLSAMIAMAWVGWAILTFLMFTVFLSAIANRGWTDPMYMRYGREPTTAPETRTY